MDGSIREPVAGLVEFVLAQDDFGMGLRGRAVYRVEYAMVFRADHHVDTSRLLASEARRADFDLCRTCLLDLVAQVREYNAVVLPVPND
ncbi:hypothetical protein FHT32_004749 [Variovorax sp. SG517]|uniref:hypothetical protein n=1 Tax=Variovorax sp. SG517 TaxID=2587117 RepID=UPI00159DC3F2|nr:hypothetical protein [Variovorax sp. SG517]NVM91085.1 hypothetical protein [Variovorax sp. SG517]